MNFLENIRALSPPTLSEIDLAIKKEGVKFKVALWLVAVALLALIALATILVNRDVLFDHTQQLATFLSRSIPISIIASYFFLFFAYRSGMRKNLLMPAPLIEYSDIDEIKKNKVLSEYISLVIDMERELTNGEFEFLRVALIADEKEAVQLQAEKRIEEKIKQVYGKSPALLDRVVKRMRADTTGT